MSHEIVGFNGDGIEIAYLRYTMGDDHAQLVYDIFDANEHNGGVSGKGASETYSLSQVELAFKSFTEWNEKWLPDSKNAEFLTWQQKDISSFLTSCLKTAQIEKV